MFVIYIYWEVIPLSSHYIRSVSSNTSDQDSIFLHVVELAQRSRLSWQWKG